MVRCAVSIAAGFRRFAVCASMLLGLATGSLTAQDAVKRLEASYEGTLGSSRVGMTLIEQNGSSALSGHYFYGKYLTDIPLTGSADQGVVTISGTDGGIFTLKFTGNGSEGNSPLNFHNSIGFAGSWSKDGKVEAVTLRAITMSNSNEAHRYADITTMSDAAFEAIVQSWYKAVLSGDRTTTAKYTHFPLRVNSKGKPQMIHSAAELSARWSNIFTAAYLARLKKDMPHDMFGRNGLASLGAGDAWFDEKGAAVLNTLP